MEHEEIKQKILEKIADETPEFEFQGGQDIGFYRDEPIEIEGKFYYINGVYSCDHLLNKKWKELSAMLIFEFDEIEQLNCFSNK